MMGYVNVGAFGGEGMYEDRAVLSKKICRY